MTIRGRADAPTRHGVDRQRTTHHDRIGVPAGGSDMRPVTAGAVCIDRQAANSQFGEAECEAADIALRTRVADKEAVVVALAALGGVGVEFLADLHARYVAAEFRID